MKDREKKWEYKNRNKEARDTHARAQTNIDYLDSIKSSKRCLNCYKHFLMREYSRKDN